MGRSDVEDKRSRVARGALVVLGFAAVIVVAWMITLYEKPQPVDTDAHLCEGKGDRPACERMNAKLISACDASKDGYPCIYAGDGLAKLADWHRSLAQYDRACALKNRVGCLRAAGVVRDIEHDGPRTQDYFEKACTLGNDFACDERAKCYVGIVVDGGAPPCPRDLVKARAYVVRACEIRGQGAWCESLGPLDEMMKDGGR